MEKIRPRIADFKNDLVFKYLLSNMKDVQCYYLLKLIIEEIAHIKTQEITVLNSELNPSHISDKDMILDVQVKTEDGELIDIESFLEKSIIVFKLMNLACLIIKSIEEIRNIVKIYIK